LATSLTGRLPQCKAGFLNLPFDRGDSVTADREFTVEVGSSCSHHLFWTKGKMSPEEVAETQSVASLRNHVERGINKTKNFRIWHNVVPYAMIGAFNVVSECHVM